LLRIARETPSLIRLKEARCEVDYSFSTTKASTRINGVIMSAATSFATELPVAKATLGKNVIVKGEIRSQEDLTIEGEVEGTIDMIEHRLTIAANGNVRANVKVREIEVLGSIHGKIEAVDRVYIRKGAELVGDIHSAGIIIEDGGYIKGSIELSHQPADSQTVSSNISLSERWGAKNGQTLV
jgi:cytoskeletal protein CcmA (bactofilin family)